MIPRHLTQDDLIAVKIIHYHLLIGDPVEADSSAELLLHDFPEPHKKALEKLVADIKLGSPDDACARAEQLVLDVDAAVS
jgi:hypothetical protein